MKPDVPKLVLPIRILYHATTLDQMDSLLDGIDPRYTVRKRKRLDFGVGFYTTTKLSQASDFAFHKKDMRGSIAVYLQFNLPLGFWSNFKGIEFPLMKRAPARWKSFVKGHRFENAPPVTDADYVCGPVADGYSADNIPNAIPGYDQISFHSDKAAKALNEIMSQKGGLQVWVWSNRWIQRRL